MKAPLLIFIFEQGFHYMKVKRWISSNTELEKKITAVKAHVETWSTLWQATSESDIVPYNQMIDYQTLEQRYAIQLEKRQEKVKAIKLKNLYDDLLLATQEYLASNCVVNLSRLDSINRLLTHCESTLSDNLLSVDEKRIEIAGFLLKELNDTESSHNNNFFSRKYTLSKLATAYMSVFEENGIEPNSVLIQNKANELKAKERESGFCGLFSLKII